jgi:predicted DNA-binding transcriptional regulator YafY
MRDEVRVFALDRVKMLHQTRESFDIPEDFSLEEFTGTSFGVFQGPLTKVKIRFSPDIAGYVKEKVWHESQKIVEQKDGSVIFGAVVAGTDEIRFWVMGWGSHADVLEPEALREQIRERELGRQKKTVRHQPQ